MTLGNMLSHQDLIFHLKHGGKDICFLSSKTKKHTAVKASERMMSLITQHTYILQLRDAFCIREFNRLYIKKIHNFNLFGNLEDMRAWSSDEVGNLKCGKSAALGSHAEVPIFALKSWMTLGKCFNLSVLQFLLL